MLKLVIGGAASGKSEFAQRLIEEDAGGGELVYLATMEARDKESLTRIERHVRLREGRSYRTVECCRDIGRAAELIKEGSFVLIEDITNLCANEMFSDRGTVIRDVLGLAGRITDGIERLCETAGSGEAVAVTGELFSDTNVYEGDVRTYLKLLSEVNRRLAERAQYVAEIVCGLPNRLK